MWYETSLTIPAGTLETAPVVATIKATYGVIHQVHIEAGAGVQFTAAVRVFYHDHQIYPTNPDGEIALDAIPRDFVDRQELFSEPYDIVIKGYAPDADYDYVFNIGLGIMLPSAFPEYRQDESLLKAVLRLLGVK